MGFYQTQQVWILGKNPSAHVCHWSITSLLINHKLLSMTKGKRFDSDLLELTMILDMGHGSDYWALMNNWSISRGSYGITCGWQFSWRSLGTTPSTRGIIQHYPQSKLSILCKGSGLRQDKIEQESINVAWDSNAQRIVMISQALVFFSLLVEDDVKFDPRSCQLGIQMINQCSKYVAWLSNRRRHCQIPWASEEHNTSKSTSFFSCSLAAS